MWLSQAGPKHSSEVYLAKTFWSCSNKSIIFYKTDTQKHKVTKRIIGPGTKYENEKLPQPGNFSGCMYVYYSMWIMITTWESD